MSNKKKKDYYLRDECYLPEELCHTPKDATEKIEGRCRTWPKELDEVYRNAYPDLHRRLDNFRNKQL